MTATGTAPGTQTSCARRAAAYVVALLWALPLLAFSVVAARADATTCLPAQALADGMPCDAQGVVVATGVLSAALLIPVGLVALLVVTVLARSGRRPAAVAAVATAAGLALGGVAVGVGAVVLS